MKKEKNLLKMFVVRKYIMATDAKQAMIKDKVTLPDDIYVDAEWKSEDIKYGFHS